MSIGENSDSIYAQRISAEELSRLQPDRAQASMRAPFEDAAKNSAATLAALNALPQEIKLSPETSSFLQFSQQYLQRAQLTGEGIDARSQRIAYISMLNHNLRDHGYAELTGDPVNNFVADGSPQHLPQRLNAEMPSSLKIYGEGEFEQLRNMVLRQPPETAIASGLPPAATDNVASGLPPAVTDNMSVDKLPYAQSMPMSKLVADMLPNALADLLPRSNVGDMLSYMSPSAIADVAPYMLPPSGPTYVVPDAPPYSYQPAYPPSMRSESVYIVPPRREETAYAPLPRHSEMPPGYGQPRHNEPLYASPPRRPEYAPVPPRVTEAPRSAPQNFAPARPEHPGPSRAEIAEARQARQQLAELAALRRQYDFRSYLPIQKSTAQQMLTYMPAEKQRALGDVFEKVSRDGRTITAADIDAYSLKYTGHRFFENA